MDLWMQAMKEIGEEDTENTVEDIKTEDQELKVEGDKSQITKNTTQEVVIRLQVQAMTAAETKMSTSYCNNPVLEGLVEDNMFATLQVR